MKTRFFQAHRASRVAILACCFALPFANSRAEDTPAFGEAVAPILQKYCYECHGPEARKGGLRLSNEADARLGGDSHVSPLAAAEDGTYPLLKRILSEEEDVRMPPKGDRVSPEDGAILKAWLEAGAPFGGESPAARSAKADIWSFKAPVQPAPPAMDTATWGRNAIDAFVLQTMKTKGLSPSPEALQALQEQLSTAGYLANMDNDTLVVQARNGL